MQVVFFSPSYPPEMIEYMNTWEAGT